jgi:UDP-4-amino-4,6-dideoxy-N-acetyl-beta-L-altrosamine transaminase
MSEFIPYGRQNISEADIEAVSQVLRSDWLTQGPIVPAFEEAVATKCNAKYAVASNSATSSLHLACLALGVGPDDTVWTTPNTFVASANCALYCGASVDFVDIDPFTWCLSVERLEQKLKHHQVSGLPIPKVVIPVHLSGQSCDMSAIGELGLKYGFSIIEDASHAIGGTYQNKPVGTCCYSAVTVFSFHPVKIITSGEGGMALTNDSELSERMNRLRTHGITRNPKLMSFKSTPWHYEQLELGFNYRMTDIHAALGMSQLDRLDEFVQNRNDQAKNYDKKLESLRVKKQIISEDTLSARHLYIIRVPHKKHGKLFEILRSENIGVNLHYQPVHLQPYYRKIGFKEGNFPESESYAHEAISLPIFPSMTEKQQNNIIKILEKEL